MLQNASLLRKSAPGRLMNMSLVLRLPRKMLQMSHACHRFLQNPHIFLIFHNVHIPLRLPRKNDIWTSKSAPNLSFFLHFWLEMCFAPQRRALFRHLNFQKWSERGVFCTFWLRNVLRATTACTFSTSQLRKVLRTWGGFSFSTACIFSTSQLPKVVRTWCVLCILTSTCVSRHNGMQFFISHLPRGLRNRRFSEPTFRPSGATNHWKNTGFCDFPTFSRTWIFFLLTLSLLWSSLFYSSLLSDSSHLCFSSVHCRKFDV